MPSMRSTWGTRLSANIVSWSRSVKSATFARPGGDRVVAGSALTLAQRREPARPEVDRVERQPERRESLAICAGGALRVGAGGDACAEARRDRQADRVQRDLIALDPDMAG